MTERLDRARKYLKQARESLMQDRRDSRYLASMAESLLVIAETTVAEKADTDATVAELRRDILEASDAQG